MKMKKKIIIQMHAHIQIVCILSLSLQLPSKSVKQSHLSHQTIFFSVLHMITAQHEFGRPKRLVQCLSQT